jgi:hypothetical protein
MYGVRFVERESSGDEISSFKPQSKSFNDWGNSSHINLQLVLTITREVLLDTATSECGDADHIALSVEPLRYQRTLMGQ